MPILSRAILHRGLSQKGFLRPAQFRALGYNGPFKGWKKDLVGKTFSQEQLDDFVRLRKTSVAPTRKERERGKLKRIKSSHKKNQANKNKSSYSDDLKNPKWTAKRNKIISRDRHRCVMCGDGGSGVKLNVHHLLYDKDLDMWEVPDFYLVTLCDSCHHAEHSKRLSPPRKHF